MMSPTPPEGLAAQVKDEINARFEQPQVASYLGIEADVPLRSGAIRPIPRYSLALTHPTTVEKVHSMVAVSSWSFLVDMEPEDGGDPVSILAEAGQTADGGFQYSSVLGLPASFLGARMFGLVEDASNDWAILAAPYYYLEAFWNRTKDPADDRLVFLRSTFNRFPVWKPGFPETEVKLAELIDYLNEQLERSY